MSHLPWLVVCDPSLDAIAKPPEAQLSVLHEALDSDRALPSTVLCLQLEREIPVIERNLVVDKGPKTYFPLRNKRQPKPRQRGQA